MATEIDLICAIAAIIIGSVIGLYIALLEKREREGILQKAKGNRYIGTKKSKKFHYYTCRHVKRKYRAGKNFNITFVSYKEAIDRGFKPCQQCLI